MCISCLASSPTQCLLSLLLKTEAGGWSESFRRFFLMPAGGFLSTDAKGRERPALRPASLSHSRGLECLLHLEHLRSRDSCPPIISISSALQANRKAADVIKQSLLFFISLRRKRPGYEARLLLYEDVCGKSTLFMVPRRGSSNSVSERDGNRRFSEADSMFLICTFV